MVNATLHFASQTNREYSNLRPQLSRFNGFGTRSSGDRVLVDKTSNSSKTGYISLFVKLLVVLLPTWMEMIKMKPAIKNTILASCLGVAVTVITGCGSSGDDGTSASSGSGSNDTGMMNANGANGADGNATQGSGQLSGNGSSDGATETNTGQGAADLDEGADNDATGATSGTTPSAPAPSGTTNGGPVVYAGSVAVDQDGSSASAIFFKVNVAIANDTATGVWAPQQDDCTYSEFDLNTTPTVPDLDFGSSVVTVDAGEVITLTSSAGSYGELIKVTQQGQIGYEASGNGSLPGAIPANTVVDIPGAEFPAFSNVTVPRAPALSNFTQSTAVVRPDSVYTWTANNSPNSRINFSATSLPNFADGNVDISSVVISSIFCTLVDDGSFSFPSDIQAQMIDFTAPSYEASRSVINFQRNGNALLSVVAESE